MEKNRIVILIPSHNEIKTLKKICLNIKKLGFKILVIDDNSNDKTSFWLKKNTFHFIKNKKKLGYEKSLIIGIKYIIKNSNDNYLITFDADGEHQVKDLKKIEKKINLENSDLIICNRNKLNRWSEYILSFLFYTIYRIKDPLSGLKAYSIDKLKIYKNKIKKNYFFVDVISFFIKKKFTITNIPINTKKRKNESDLGNDIFINVKILKITKLLFFN